MVNVVVHGPRLLPRTAVVAVYFLLAVIAQAQGPAFLVKDINAVPTVFPSFLTNVDGRLFFIVSDPLAGSGLWRTDGTVAGSVRVATAAYGPLISVANGPLYFVADDGTSGPELWRTDGTLTGTLQVKDIQPGPNGSNPYSLTDLNGVLFFVADDGTSGPELWRSDGTESGTVRVKDVQPGPGGSYPVYLTVVNGSLFFGADDGSNGSQVWRSDGTEAGTVRVTDTHAGPSGLSVSHLTDVNGTLFFVAFDQTRYGHLALWRSDGTESGTTIVAHVSVQDTQFVIVNGTLFFVADDGKSGAELWRSDGTEIGSRRVKDIRPGTDGSNPQYLTDVNGALFFVADDGRSGLELWRSDGTESGTMRVKDIEPGPSGSNPFGLTNVNGALFFAAFDDDGGWELWRSDGSERGTLRVKDIQPGPNGSNPFNLTDVNGTLFFVADTGGAGLELWRSDGTEAGTARVSDVHISFSAPASFATVAGALCFVADDAEIWRSDGTDAGTVPLTHTGHSTSGSSSYSGARYLTDLNGTLMFLANDGRRGSSGSQLWRSDGTATGTQFVADLSSQPTPPTQVGEALYFSLGYEIWKTDGTAAGTQVVKDVNGNRNSDGEAVDPPERLTDLNGTLFFVAFGERNATELWRSDGTGSGTEVVKAVHPADEFANPSALTNADGTLFFTARRGTFGTEIESELWKSDGTENGTTLVKSFRPEDQLYNPYALTAVNATLFFAVVRGSEQFGMLYELWKSDGTEDGTARVATYGASTSLPLQLTNVNGTLFFITYEHNGDRTLWRSDGTTAGTVSLGVVATGLREFFYLSPPELTNVNGTAFFRGGDPTTGFELWTSDGTVTGTRPVKDIEPGPVGSDPAGLTNVNGTLLFSADDGRGGRALWKSDGTEEGTVRLQDIALDIDPFSSPFAVSDQNVFFAANDGAHGSEIWNLPISALVPACVGDCDGRGSITVDELIEGINIALGGAVLDACRSFDTSGDGLVAVDELLASISAALNGCRQAPG